MRTQEIYTEYHDNFEYFGTRRLNGFAKKVKKQYGMTG